jgi:hypothetical protein
MNFDTKKTIKNWRWWAVLPIVLPFFVVALIPMAIITILELLIVLVEFVSFGERLSPLAKRIIDWANTQK